MLGMIYLILSGVMGYEVVKYLLLPQKMRRIRGINNIWFMFPAAFGTGTLLLTWLVYIVSWISSVAADVKQPLMYGNLAGFLVGTAVVAGMIKHRREKSVMDEVGKCGFQMIENRSWFKKECIFFLILLVFISYMMIYVFIEHKGGLYAGFTVYGDYAPHTAMMRSFSMGNNFPTQYPHYGGADVKYHFMFQFLSGNLEYLGMPLDVAYNLTSTLSLVGFLMLLYLLAVRITGKTAAGMLASLFFFFRSGMAVFQFAWEHWKAGDLWNAFAENSSFIGYTMNENWGLWNFNVYLNQRHLAFGLLLVTMAIWIYMDWLEAGLAHEEKGFAWLKGRFFSKEAWKCRHLETAIMLGMILGLSAFWNGAALIGGLLILMGFGIFSDGKTDYAITAAIAVLFSSIQSRMFICGQAMNPKFYFGFIADKKTFDGVFAYLFMMSGIFFLGLIVIEFFLDKRKNIILLSFLFPLFFAFSFSLTPDINVNHKYIMISYAFLTIFWADILCRIFRKNCVGKIAAVLLAICITATGVYDFVIILRGNGPGRRIRVKTESDITSWLAENMEKNDLILTPQYSMNEITMSGAMLYCGWPYYAWSAGYDTNYRAAQAIEMYTTDSSERLKEIVEQEKITYILFEEGMEFEQRVCREDVIQSTYPRVFISKDGRIRIYETMDKKTHAENSSSGSAGRGIGISAEK